MGVIVCFEGYTPPDAGYIAKELFILYPNGKNEHFLFKRPNIPLTEEDLRCIRYTTKNINHLAYNDGLVEYNHINHILESIQNQKIFTYGQGSVQFILKYIPTANVINIQDWGYKMPDRLENKNCFRSHSKYFRYCAKSKAWALFDYLDKK